MAWESNQTLETKYYKIEKLVKWEHVIEVNEMLLTGVSPRFVSDWCKTRGFSISQTKLYEYKDMLEAAAAKQITVEKLLGIGVPKRTPVVMNALALDSAKDIVRNEMDVLDMIINKGFQSIATDPDIRVSDAMKAIELKNKLTKGAHGGLTGYGLDQLRALEEAKFNAMVDVVKKYIPEDRIEELLEALEEAERTFYKEFAPEYLEEYDRSVDEGNRNPDSVIVADTRF